MARVKCDQCDLPRESFVGPEEAPFANFCREHGRALTKASSKRLGVIFESIMRKRAAEYGTRVGDPSPSCTCGHSKEEHPLDPQYPGSTSCGVCGCIAYEASE